MAQATSRMTRVSLVCLLLLLSSRLCCHGFMVDHFLKPMVEDWTSFFTSWQKKALGVRPKTTTRSRKALMNPNEESSGNSNNNPMVKLSQQQWTSLLPGAISSPLIRKQETKTNNYWQLKQKVSTFSSARRIGKLPVEKLVEALDYELFKTQWFVTGNVNPAYFCKDFVYEDPDIQYCSLEDYAMDVHALFDQSCTKAEVIDIDVDDERPNVITCTWRLSGRANLLWGLDIKPLYVYTDFTVNEQNGLIQSQEDRYSLPQWDLFVSAMFPWLNGIVTASEAPPAPSRIVTPSRQEVTPMDAFSSRAKMFSYLGGGGGANAVPPVSELARRRALSTTTTTTTSRTLAITSSSSNNGNKVVPSYMLYNDSGRRSSQTRPVTPEEYAKLMRDNDSPLNGLVHLVQEGLDRHQKSIVLSTSKSSYSSEVPWYATTLEEGEPEIRAILADGTKVPAIRAPTWKDRAKLYMHIDHAGTIANLKEASKRAATRRYNKYYNGPTRSGSVEGDYKDDNGDTTADLSISQQINASVQRTTAPVSYFVRPSKSWNVNDEASQI